MSACAKSKDSDERLRDEQNTSAVELGRGGGHIGGHLALPFPAVDHHRRLDWEDKHS